MSQYISLSPLTFEESAQRIKTLSKSPTDDEMLQLYALYKQATIGDCNIEKPSFWNITAKAKWEAWNTLLGTSIYNAKQRYITLTEQLLAKYSS